MKNILNKKYIIFFLILIFLFIFIYLLIKFTKEDKKEKKLKKKFKFVPKIILSGNENYGKTISEKSIDIIPNFKIKYNVNSTHETKSINKVIPKNIKNGEILIDPVLEIILSKNENYSEKSEEDINKIYLNKDNRKKNYFSIIKFYLIKLSNIFLILPFSILIYDIGDSIKNKRIDPVLGILYGYFFTSICGATFKSLINIPKNKYTKGIITDTKSMFVSSFYFITPALSFQSLIAKKLKTYGKEEIGKGKYLVIFAIKRSYLLVSSMFFTILGSIYFYRGIFLKDWNIIHIWNNFYYNKIENISDFLSVTILFYVFGIGKTTYTLLNGILLYGEKKKVYFVQKFGGAFVRLISSYVLLKYIISLENFSLSYSIGIYIVSHLSIILWSGYHSMNLILGKNSEKYNYGSIVSDYYDNSNEEFWRVFCFRFLTNFLYSFNFIYLKIFFPKTLEKGNEFGESNLIYVTGKFILAGIPDWFQGASMAMIPVLQGILEKNYNNYDFHLKKYIFKIYLRVIPLFNLFVFFFSGIINKKYSLEGGIGIGSIFHGVLKKSKDKYSLEENDNYYYKLTVAMSIQIFLQGSIIFFENLSILRGNYIDKWFKFGLVFSYAIGGIIFKNKFDLEKGLNLECFMITCNLIYFLSIFSRFYYKNIYKFKILKTSLDLN